MRLVIERRVVMTEVRTPRLDEGSAPEPQPQQELRVDHAPRPILYAIDGKMMIRKAGY